MSRTWDGEASGQDGQGPGTWDAQGDPGENRKKTGREAAEHIERPTRCKRRERSREVERSR